MNKEQLIAQIDAFFGDMSRSQEETRDALMEVSEHAQSLAESIELNNSCAEGD